LPFESREEFEQLHARLKEEWPPDGAAEEETVFDIAHLFWIKRRLKKSWTASGYADPFMLELIESGRRSWPGLRSSVRKKAREDRGLTDDLHQLLAILANDTAKFIQGVALSEDEQRRCAKVLQIIRDQFLPVIERFQLGPSADRTFGQLYAPEHISSVVRAEAAIDARIDKLFSRLVSLQERKRIQKAYSSSGDRFPSEARQTVLPPVRVTPSGR
jgi:hypothetical protein